MGIQIQRVFVREHNGSLSHHTPSGLTYDLVIELTADVTIPPSTFYQIITAPVDLTSSTPPPPPMVNVGGPPIAIGVSTSTDTWTTIGGRQEGVLVRTPSGIPATAQDHLFKYSVLMKQIGGTDADGADSEIFVMI